MFTVEIRINGSMIGHIYGHNEGDTADGCKYRYEYYEPETRKLIKGNIEHKRSKGIRQLITQILNDIEKPEPKETTRERAMREFGV